MKCSTTSVNILKWCSFPNNEHRNQPWSNSTNIFSIIRHLTQKRQIENQVIFNWNQKKTSTSSRTPMSPTSSEDHRHLWHNQGVPFSEKEKRKPQTKATEKSNPVSPFWRQRKKSITSDMLSRGHTPQQAAILVRRGQRRRAVGENGGTCSNAYRCLYASSDSQWIFPFSKLFEKETAKENAARMGSKVIYRLTISGRKQWGLSLCSTLFEFDRRKNALGSKKHKPTAPENEGVKTFPAFFSQTSFTGPVVVSLTDSWIFHF